MKPTFKLHSEPAVSKDAVAFFDEMAEAARQGEVLGWTGAWMTKDRQFFTQTVGEPNRNPVYAIGMLVVLVARLIRKILK